MSATPRTDAFCDQWPDEIEPIMIPAIMRSALVLMSELEREIEAARRDANQWETQCRVARIQRDKLAEVLQDLCDRFLGKESSRDITDQLVAAGNALAAVKGAES